MFESTGSELFEKNTGLNLDFGKAEAIVKTTLKTGQSLNKAHNQQIETQISETKIMRRFEFTSKLQRMSAVVKCSQDDGFYRLHIKGAPEKIRELCTSDSIPENFHEILSKYTIKGLRVLALASKILKISESDALTLERHNLEGDFRFVGFLLLQNKLKEITPSIIDKLHQALIRSVMVTGDNALTAISVARECGIVKPSYRVLLGTLEDDPAVLGRKKIIWENLEFPERRSVDSLVLENIDSLAYAYDVEVHGGDSHENIIARNRSEYKQSNEIFF